MHASGYLAVETDKWLEISGFQTSGWYTLHCTPGGKPALHVGHETTCTLLGRRGHQLSGSALSQPLDFERDSSAEFPAELLHVSDLHLQPTEQEAAALYTSSQLQHSQSTAEFYQTRVFASGSPAVLFCCVRLVRPANLAPAAAAAGPA